MIEQGSDEWFQQRLGKVTASRVADVLATTKSGPAATRKNYMAQLLCERLTGQKEESYTNAAMQRGIDLECIARSAYEVKNNVMVFESDFVDHPELPNFGASPDGIVLGVAGLIEIKCLNTANHLEFMETKKIPLKYQYQMQTQMMCTGRVWCDYVCFDDRLPENLQYCCVRFDYNEELASKIYNGVEQFNKELEAKIKLLGEMNNG